MSLSSLSSDDFESSPLTPSMAALVVPEAREKSELGHHLDAISRLLQHAVTAPQSIVGLQAALQCLETRMSGVESQLRSRHDCTTERGSSALPTILLLDGSRFPFSDILVTSGEAGGRALASEVTSFLAGIMSNSFDAPSRAVSCPDTSPPKLDFCVFAQIFVPVTDKDAAGSDAPVSFNSLGREFTQGLREGNPSITVIECAGRPQDMSRRMHANLAAFLDSGFRSCIALHEGPVKESFLDLFSNLSEARRSRCVLADGIPPQPTIDCTLKTVNVRDCKSRTELAENVVQEPARAPARRRQYSEAVLTSELATQQSVSSSAAHRLSMPDISRQEPVCSPHQAKATHLSRSDGGSEQPAANPAVTMQPVPRKSPSHPASVRNMIPRPCHLHYLGPTGCRRPNICPYDHERDLDKQQIAELAILAKAVICPYFEKGICNFSDAKCFRGHRCPNGPSCHLAEKCRFQGILNSHSAQVAAASDHVSFSLSSERAKPLQVKTQGRSFKHTAVASDGSLETVKVVIATNSPLIRPSHHDWFNDHEETEAAFDWAA